MPVRSKRVNALRLAFFAGLLVVELSVIAIVYVPFRTFATASAPIEGRWKQEVPFGNAWWLPFAVMAIVVVFAMANIGILITIWRAVKQLNANESN